MSGDIASVYGGQGVDVQNGQGMDNFDPLPAGWYEAMVDEAEVKQTQAGTGNYLKLRFHILTDAYNGRRVFKNINLRNPNRQAEEIGQRELVSFGRAIGIPIINDSTECLNRPLFIKLKITRDDEYGDQNDVTGFKPLDQLPAPIPAPAPAPIQPSAAPMAPQQAPVPAPTVVPPAAAQPAPVAYQPAPTPPPAQPAATYPVQPAQPVGVAPASGMPWKR